MTQHAATTEQAAVGVVEPTNKKAIQDLLTFDEIPAQAELRERAETLAFLVTHEPSFDGAVMIGGAPYFMAPLEHALRVRGIRTLYAFAKRDSVDQVQADGSIKKTQIFRHAGFVEVAD